MGWPWDGVPTVANPVWDGWRELDGIISEAFASQPPKLPGFSTPVLG